MCYLRNLANFQLNWTSRSKVSNFSHFIHCLSSPIVTPPPLLSIVKTNRIFIVRTPNSHNGKIYNLLYVAPLSVYIFNNWDQWWLIVLTKTWPGNSWQDSRRQMTPPRSGEITHHKMTPQDDTTRWHYKMTPPKITLKDDTKYDTTRCHLAGLGK